MTSTTIPTPPNIADRLRSHRLTSRLPANEIEWLIRHGHAVSYAAGTHFYGKGDPINDLFIILDGHFAIHVDRGTGPRRVMEWRRGDISGVFPFSRMKHSPGDSLVSESVEGFAVSRDHFPELVRECPVLTETLVHVMLDRARHFNSTDMLDEKLMSLGRLTAGVAHQLNNPSSAAVRAAGRLLEGLRASDAASRSLGAAGLGSEEENLIEYVREHCLSATPTTVASPIEMADREDELAAWCIAHGADPHVAQTLAETWITVDQLDRLADELSPETLSRALSWIAAGCHVHSLTREIGTAARRIHELVMSMKRMTRMDQAPVLEPVNVMESITDSLAVIRSLASDVGASVVIDAPPDLRPASARGGELHNIWEALLTNAFDAVAEALPGKRDVQVVVREETPWIVIRVVDSGKGIPPENLSRIFEPFFTTKPPGKGTGLGLDIVRKIVLSHNGEVDVTSVPGRTEFRVALPTFN
ncbi:MAG: ATP-binding protein [Gemmatimonadota bacterium]